jgi:hypothetical protein
MRILSGLNIVTEKGEALQPIVDQMAAFSMQYCAKEVFKDGKARKLDEVYGYNGLVEIIKALYE